MYYAELVSFFAGSLKSRDAAQDVVQEAYARVLALQQDGTAVRNLRAMLYRVGKNVVVDDLRRRGTEARMLESLAIVQPSHCLLYTSPSPRDKRQSRMPSSA